MNKKMLGHFLFVCLLLFPFLSCTDHMQERVAIALNFSKDNKQELEKVLSYYKGQPSKLKAAQFLIANMPYHYTYVGWEIDTLKQLKKGVLRKEKSVRRLYKGGTILTSCASHMSMIFIKFLLHI